MFATDIVSKFLHIVTLLENFKLHIDSELMDKPAWVNDWKLMTDKQAIKNSFTEFSHHNLISQSTLSCPGALAGTNETLLQIAMINEAKDDFRRTVGLYLDSFKTKNTRIIRDILTQSGFSPIRLRQVYRRIHVVQFHPKRISFTRTHHSSHRIITREEALIRLDKVGKGANIELQKKRLAAIDDPYFVVRHQIKPIWAVNISTFKKDNGQINYMKYMTRLPIVYLHDDSLPLPIVGLSRPYTRHKLIARCDKSIEPIPVLPSIFAYRYKVGE